MEQNEITIKFLTAKSEYVISKQILRSGTSIGANIEEATSTDVQVWVSVYV